MEGNEGTSRARQTNWRSQQSQERGNHSRGGSRGQGRGRYLQPHSTAASSDQSSGSGRPQGRGRRIGSGRIQISEDTLQNCSKNDETNNYKLNSTENARAKGQSSSQGKGNAWGYHRDSAAAGPSQMSHQETKLQLNQHQESSRNYGNKTRNINQRQYDPLPYTRLQKLANTENNVDVVHVLANSENGFEKLIQESLRPDLFFLLMKVLYKVCISDFDESKSKILSQACSEAKFVDQFMTQIMSAEKKTSNELKELIQNILMFFETVVQILPLTACDTLRLHIMGCSMVSEGLNTRKNLSLENGTLEKFKALISDLDKMQSQHDDEKSLKKESRNERLQMLPPPDDFRNISLYPSSEDVLSGQVPFLRPNIVKGKYDNIEHYLDVQFRLLREDFIRPLREGIAAHSSGDRKQQRDSSVRMYSDVRFIRSDDERSAKNPKRHRDVEGTLVSFDPKGKLKKVDWEHNRRFMYGSLLCFSRDNFKTLLVSTVSDRDVKGLEAGVIRVEFCQTYEENVYNSSYLMIESEVFFEPYYQVLKTLQSLTEQNFPLAEYLVDAQEDDFVPAYLEEDIPVIYKLRSGGGNFPVVVLNRQTWPTADELDLDRSQFEALHAALTRELVVIQGPPGTGKTFIGLKIAQILIENKLVTKRRTPILVVCLTNHALDQFLMGILRYTQKIVRIGGQSRCEELAEFNLRFVRKQTKSREYVKLLINIRQEISILQREIATFDSNLRIVKENAGIIAFEMFQEADVLPQDVVNQLKSGKFLMWLLEADTEQQRGEIDVCNIKFELLLEEFDKKINDLELQKMILNEEMDVELIEFQQSQLMDAKEWIETKLQNQEIPNPLQRNQWIKNLWSLNSVQRWQLYFYWLQQLEEVWLGEIRQRENEMIAKNKELAEMQVVEDLEVLRESDVIGMTTTGAARHHAMLRKLGPEIVIVEEAAEVMESHVVACLTQRCMHLILIGDHKQLRPSIAVYQLGVKYDFDVSLFERLVRNRGQCVTLGVQHRMSPCIAKLVTPAIYDHLENADTVKVYPEVLGVPQRLFFIQHSHPEEMMDKDSNSRINKHEAHFLIQLCRHLILQGYKPSQITILSTYRGQMFYIRKEMKKQESLKGVVVTVVDNYQGEENDIILLSLVRSNQERHIGFLATENRVCVALSRAKHGMYIVGNMDCLTEAAKVKPEKNIWKKIRATLEKEGALGDALPLRCQVHPEQYFEVSSAKQFMDKSPEGGCTQLCTSMLDCGHICNRLCHALARDHVDMKCLQRCDRLCAALEHNCQKKCYEPCGDCTVIVEKLLPCGHKVNLQCHVDVTKVRCDEMVLKTFYFCGHKARVKCHIDPHSQCPVNCDNRLNCGHQCVKLCHALDDPDHLEYKCRKPCGKPNKGCSMNHECGKLCCDDCSNCTIKVAKKRSCGHSHHMECSADPESIVCKGNCPRILLCGHKCRRKCNELCNPCLEIVTKKITTCGHEVQVACGIVATGKLCKNQCVLKLRCGHPCTEPCSKPCTERCMKEVGLAMGACGHRVPLLCWEYQKGITVPSSSSRCRELCPAVLHCGHLCPGTCGKCCQGRFHELCDQPCGRVLVCGHSCKEPCAETCPPCKEKCTYFCQHSKCPKKCGEPCAPCKERCSWQCKHKVCKRKCSEPCNRDPCDEPCEKKLKCGHLCVGFCGEPCPKLCQVCNNDELTDIFLGHEDEPNARFVLLPDCGHSVEVQGLKSWMGQNTDVVGTKGCPRCKTGVNRVPRFGNEIKQAYNDIAKVKGKTFGNPTTIEKKRKKLHDDVTKLLTDSSIEDSFVELHWVLQATLKSLEAKVDGRRNALSGTAIRAREIEVDVLSKLCDMWGKCKTLPSNVKEELKVHINLMLENLESKKHRMGQQQVEDFKLEILRLQRITQYLAFKNKGAIYPNIVPLLNQFKALILDLTKRFSVSSHQKVEDIYQRLKESCKNLPGLGIDEYERVQIVNALHLQKGHWFKCPNGHPYIITECGGATMESNCPECGARIGGGHHQLRSDNSFFAGMDLSQHAAWSEQANMQNYNFDHIV